MKKILRYSGTLLLVTVVLLGGYYFTKGLLLNVSLKESLYGGDNFYISVGKTDENYKGGICANLLRIYPWEMPLHPPQELQPGTHRSVECTKQDRVPFGFRSVSGWEDEKITTLPFDTRYHPFYVVRNLFFSESRSICLSGINEKLRLVEKEYKPQWFTVRGIKYEIEMTEDEKEEWRAIINTMFNSGSYPEFAYMIKGENCSTYSDEDIVKTYPVKINDSF